MRHIALAALAIILLASVAPAQAGIRTDTGSLLNPDAISVVHTQSSQADAAPAKAG